MHWRRVTLTHSAVKIGCPYAEEEEQIPIFIHIGISSKWAKDINMRPKPPDAVRGKGGRSIQDISVNKALVTQEILFQAISRDKCGSHSRNTAKNWQEISLNQDISVQ